jgi:hypothetical protein
MKNRTSSILNTIMGSNVGVFIGHTIFKYIDYRNNPQRYIIQSAPWYTSVIIYGAVTLSIIFFVFFLKIFFLRKK